MIVARSILISNRISPTVPGQERPPPLLSPLTIPGPCQVWPEAREKTSNVFWFLWEPLEGKSRGEGPFLTDRSALYLRWHVSKYDSRTNFNISKAATSRKESILLLDISPMRIPRVFMFLLVQFPTLAWRSRFIRVFIRVCFRALFVFFGYDIFILCMFSCACVWMCVCVCVCVCLCVCVCVCVCFCSVLIVISTKTILNKYYLGLRAMLRFLAPVTCCCLRTVWYPLETEVTLWYPKTGIRFITVLYPLQRGRGT